MKLIGNVLWILFGGLVGAIGWMIAGFILMITIIGIPFGKQCFKIAGLTLWPFGTEVSIGAFGAMGLIGNILWILIFGWELFLYHLGLGLLFSITIIGIPFGKQHFKLARIALVPFGASIS